MSDEQVTNEQVTNEQATNEQIDANRREGLVVSVAQEKTAVVETVDRVRHRRYGENSSAHQKAPNT